MFDFDELLGIIADVVHTYGASLVAVATTTQWYAAMTATTILVLRRPLMIR